MGCLISNLKVLRMRIGIICTFKEQPQHRNDQGGSKVIKRVLNNATKAMLSNWMKVFWISGGGLVICLAVFQSENLLMAQEKTVKDESVQRRIPDDLTDRFILPSFVNDCLDKNLRLDKEITVPSVPLHNPYFVRGDFDGDGAIDYAVIVERRKDSREGLLICFRQKSSVPIILGLEAKDPPFWLLGNWDVETTDEVNKIVDAKGRPVRVVPKGDSIVMKGEDWIGIIYWDGKMFRWKKVILTEGG